MKRESITALGWYFLNCSVTQFYWVQVFSSPKYIHVSEESSTNLLLINKLLLTKDEGPNSYKQYLRGCRMILSQIFSFFSPPLLLPPPSLLLFLSAEWWGCNARRPSSFWGHPGQRVLAGLPKPQTDSYPGHWLQGFLSPLSHTRKRNFLKILIQLGGRSHLLAPCPWQQHCWGLGKWHEASHPPSFLMSRVRAGEGNSSILALTGAFPVISLCLIQPFFWGIWGEGMTCQWHRDLERFGLVHGPLDAARHFGKWKPSTSFCLIWEMRAPTCMSPVGNLKLALAKRWEG